MFPSCRKRRWDGWVHRSAPFWAWLCMPETSRKMNNSLQLLNLLVVICTVSSNWLCLGGLLRAHRGCSHLSSLLFFHKQQFYQGTRAVGRCACIECTGFARESWGAVGPHRPSPGEGYEPWQGTPPFTWTDFPVAVCIKIGKSLAIQTFTNCSMSQYL